MVKNILSFCQKNQWFIFALIVSIALHFCVLLNISFSVPKPKKSSQNLDITIIRSIKTNKDVATIQNTTAKTEAIHEHSIPSASYALQQPVKQAKVTALSPSPSADQTLAEPSSTTVSAKQDESTKKNNTEQAQQSSDLIIKSASKPSPPTYQYVELEFDILNGQSKPLGRSSATFTLDVNSTYILTETTEFQDPITGHSHAIKQKSNGVISESGLIPGYYSYQDISNPKNSVSASFAWAESFVDVLHENQTEKLPLTEGTQDALTTVYQFMFNAYDAPAPVLSGSELVQRQFQLIAEEVLSTRMGELRCLHLQSQDNNQKLDLWLALDYQLLPIKLLRVDQSGAILEEKTANSIGTVNRK